MNNTIYSVWVSERDLARTIRKLQLEGSYVQAVTIVTPNKKPMYEVEYTNIVNQN